MRLPPANAYVETTGTLVAADANGDCTLANSTTYYFPVVEEDQDLASVHLRWASALNAVVTFEDGNTDTAIANVYDVATSGNWVQENPSTAYVAVTSGAATVASMTITIPGGTAGGAVVSLSGINTRRLRVKAVVTTGAKLSVMPHGKAE